MVRANPSLGSELAGTVAGAQAVSKGLALLNLIADSPKPLRFSELQRFSNLPKGTLHRLLHALADYRLIRFDETLEAYRLGARVFEMAHRVWSEFDLRGAAEPELGRLRDLTQESVRLAVLDAGDALIIDQREYLHPMRIGNGIGARLNPIASALGKALLAYQSPEVIQRLLKDRKILALTPNTILNPDELQRELDVTKARGYAVSVEEQHIGVSSVAAPVLNHRGEAMGAISIVGPSFRLTPDRLHAFGRDVIEAARRISGNVGEAFMTIGTAVSPTQSGDGNVKCFAPSGAFLGEAPVWLGASNELLWVDILSPSAHISSLARGETRTVPLSELTGVVVPRKRGGFVAATQSGFRALDIQNGNMTELASPPGMSGRRFNDGKCDPQGRFWAGTLALDASPNQGSLFRLDADGRLTEVEKNFHICNGLGWSPDARTFYLADSGARCIYAYDFEVEAGLIENKRVWASFAGDGGIPDGLCVDSEGHVWCAMWDGWSLVRLDPTGKIERTVEMPVPRPTSCAFGGPDLRTLYITSARIRLSAAQLAAAPMSGSVFSLEVDVPGVPVSPYHG